MMRANFIPAHRRVARQRRMRTRRWAVICSAYALLLGVACVCCGVAWHVSDEGLDTELAKSSGEIAELTRSLNSAQAELSEAEGLLESIRSIAKQPDWSLLLAMVSRSLGNDVVLDTVRLGPPGGGEMARSSKMSAAPSAPRSYEPPYVLYMSGYARSQGAVSRFVLRLDELDLFERVDLLKTSREAMFEGDAVGFQVQGSFRWQRRQP